jgi:hypothetical protein
MKMKYLNILAISLFAFILISSCQDEIEDFGPNSTTSPQPYFPGISDIDVSDDVAKIYMVASGMEFGSRSPSVTIQGSFFDRERNAVGYESLTINGVEISQNITNPSPGIDPKGKFFHQFQDIESATSPEIYNDIYSLFTSTSGIELSIESQEFGNTNQIVRTPILKNVNLSENFGFDDPDQPTLYAKAGIKVTWETGQADANQRSSPPEEEVGIAIMYFPERTERLLEDQPGSFDDFPSEPMIYTVVTENDGEHTIDFSYISNFPSGGVHTFTIGAGSTYNAYIDETSNTIRVTSATIISSGDVILDTENCPYNQEC